MNWETIIGLETHVQLSTRSKIFSGASTTFGATPNTQACAVDIALPGVLPVLNKAAVEKAIMFGLAVDAKINHHSVFARKNYFYPDLPKGYQISQYELPIVQGGEIDIVSPTRGAIKVRLTRAHLEEDAGKSFHGEAISGVAGYMVAGLAVVGNPLVNEERDLTKLSGIDLNRAGTPLLEIVSEPDMRSAAEAVAYAKALHSLVRWIYICDGNMQEGSFRFDANVSVRHKGSDKLGTRCEIKNLNSFRFLEHAIEFEARRQIGILEDGGVIEQETRLYDPDKNETRSMRTKEEAHDYRYFPDPDLLPLEISESWIEEIRAKMPETQEEREAKIAAYPIPHEQVVQHAATPQSTSFALSLFVAVPQTEVPFLSNLILGPLSALLKHDHLDIGKSKVSAPQLKALSEKVSAGIISNSTATGTILPALWSGEGSVDEIIERRGLRQISDAGAIEKIVDEVLAANPKQVEDYRAGKEKAFNSLVGQVMKATQGKANPAQLNEILKRKLAG